MRSLVFSGWQCLAWLLESGVQCFSILTFRVWYSVFGVSAFGVSGQCFAFRSLVTNFRRIWLQSLIFNSRCGWDLAERLERQTVNAKAQKTCNSKKRTKINTPYKNGRCLGTRSLVFSNGVLAFRVWYSDFGVLAFRIWCFYSKDLAFRALFSLLQYLEFRLQSSSDH